MSEPSTLPQRGPSRARRVFFAVAATVSMLVTVAAGIGMAGYVWTKSHIETITDPVSSGSQGPPAFTGTCAKHSCNYLLLGSDDRAGLSQHDLKYTGSNALIHGTFRSDTIIVLHVVPSVQEATFLSFPRDLWVDIPGLGDNRINTAFEKGINGGGAQDVARTITHLTGIRIDHILYVDLAGFVKVVNALGGLDMCVPYPMSDPLTGLNIPAGCQHFDGSTALAYVRTRHQPCDKIPDFARITRQQQFLRAIIAKMLRPSEIARLPSLIPALLSSIRVDSGLNPAELDYLAGQLHGLTSGTADFRVVPTYPTWEGSASVVKLVEPQAEELFKRFRHDQPLGNLGLAQEETPPSPAAIATTVFDKRSGGSADAVLQTLTKAGFDVGSTVSRFSDIPAQPPTKGSMILYEGKNPLGKAMADVVHTYLSNMPEVPAPTGLIPHGTDIAIVAGPGYTLPAPNASPPINCSGTA